MSWDSYDTWVVLVGAVCAAACALPGCLLVLRKISMMGDAISHAVLPGLAAAYFLTGSRTSAAMFVGAVIAGILTALFTQWISEWGNVDRGAAMGIVFTVLFAAGLLMIVRAADHVELDASCVLYGNIEWTPLDTVAVAGHELPRALLVLGGVLIVNLLVLLLFYKEFRIAAFDPALATSIGISSEFMHYLLMVQVAVTTVAAFEAVGSILVIAMLIVPASTAWLLTHRFGILFLLSVVFGVLSAGLGHLAAIVVPGWFGFDGASTSGMMAAVSGLLFIVAWAATQVKRSSR